MKKIVAIDMNSSDSEYKKKNYSSNNLPVVQMHGMGDFADDPFGMVPLANAISEYLGGVYVLNVQIGNSRYYNL